MENQRDYRVNDCQTECTMAAEEPKTMKHIVTELRKQVENCFNLANSISDNLFGPTPCKNGDNKEDINCAFDAIEDISNKLNDTINILIKVNGKL